ncbi:MAG: site-specific integrase [Oscillospiraceae bacterium]|nr:site-specific integrase [Oscillospiraceae bacterium]
MPKTGRNIYKRKDGRWEGRYIKERNGNGKIVYGSVYGKTCTEIKQKLSVFVFGKFMPSPLVAETENQNLTFADVTSKWLSAISLKVKPSTFAEYKNILNLHIIPLLGKRKMQGLSAKEIGCFSKEKLENGRTDGNGGLSAKTVSDMLSIIKAIFFFAEKEKIINGGFVITYPKNQQKSMRVLSRQEQTSLENILKDGIDIHKLGILLCLYTGIRIGELCALQWKDISSGYDVLSVRQTLQRIKNINGDGTKTKIIIDIPKSQRSTRDVPIPKFLSPYLRNFVCESNEYFLNTPKSIFTEPRTMQNHFAKNLKAANIAGANFHCLRHSFATRCIEAGVDIKSLSEMLGHANVNITLNCYVHSSFEQKREGMNKLEQYIGI